MNAKSSIKRPVVHISPATLPDASAIARVYLRAFADSPRLPILAPQYIGLSEEELLRVGIPTASGDLRRRFVGPNINLKASISTTNELGKTVETIVGYAYWISPDGPRRRSFWEWFLSTIVFPLCDHIKKPAPLPEGAPSYYGMAEEQYQQVFKKGGEMDGRKHWYLRLACVDPSWQGYGIGSALLEWGFEKARKSDSLIYLETR